MFSRAMCGVAFALWLVLAASVAYAVPTGEDRESARNLFRMGDEKYQAGDYEGALVSFKAADAIMRLPTTGLEVGRTLAKVGKLIEAREKLREVANLEPEEGEVQAQVDARAEARTLFKGLADQIPSLLVRVTTKDGSEVKRLTVTINGDEMAEEAALLPRRVDPGTHEVTVAAFGYRQEKRKVTVAVAQRQVLDIELTPIELPTFDAAPPTAKPDREPTSASDGHAATALGIVSLALGGASLVVGGVTGILALVESDELEARCPDKRCTADDETLLERTVALSHVSTGTLVAGSVLAAVGVVAIVVSLGDGEVSHEQAVRLRPLVGLGLVGLGGDF